MHSPATASAALIPPQQQPQQRQFKHVILTPNHDRFSAHEPRRKRQRITVACNTCRSRKVKCDGLRPTCESCQKGKTTCAYGDNQGNDRPWAPSAPVYSRQEHRPDIVTSLAPTSGQRSSSPLESPGSSQGSTTRFLISAFNNDVNSPDFIFPQSTDTDPAVQDLPQRSPETSDEIRTPSKIRIPYFRWFGPTGIVPGFTKVLVDLRRSSSSPSSGSRPANTPAHHLRVDASPQETFSPPVSEASHSSAVFNHGMVPNMDILEHLLAIFFAYYGSHFPFYERNKFLISVRSENVPAVLLNSMCALAARFSTHPQVHRNPIYLSGEMFGDRAKQLVIVLLSVPSYDLVASLLMLSWYEYGCNRDVGFWMYTGMAIRMAQDLGMHKISEQTGRIESHEADGLESGLGHSNDHENTGKATEAYWNESSTLRLNLFWSIYFIDRIISLGTGRPLTLRDEQISCPFPSDGATQADSTQRPNPFPHMLRIMSVQGKVNEEISTIRQPEDLTPTKRQIISKLQEDLISIYTNLDRRLSFNVTNFQSYVTTNDGGSFLLLHVWFHAVIITLHRPGLMHGFDTLAHTLGEQSLEVSMSSAKTITAILGLAEAFDDRTIVGTPFLNQAIYIAGLAFIAEADMYANVHSSSPLGYGGGWKDLARSGIPPPPPNPNGQEQEETPITASRSLLRLASKRNYETCLHAEQALKRYWRGIGWILSTMEQKAAGIAKTDPSEESVDPNAEIDLRDSGMLRRLLAVRDEIATRRSRAVSASGGGVHDSRNDGRSRSNSRTDHQGVGNNNVQQGEMAIGMGFAGESGAGTEAGEGTTMAILYPGSEAWEMSGRQAWGDGGASLGGNGAVAWDDLAWLDALGPVAGNEGMR